ncbi:MAG: DNA repair protein RecO [Acidobacteria bacterium]|nr:MAG: DNA repair protein RecO [Acidobacteriota bacterium]
MPIHESEAVVLRRYPFSEADLVVVFFTRDFGKVRAAASGAKRTKSRLGGALEPLNHVRLRFFLKEGADLGRVTECETLSAYLGRRPSPELLYAFSYLAEIIHELVEENNPNIPLFRLLLATLEASAGAVPRPLLLRYFELWTLRLSGFLPNYDYCSACGRYVKEDGFYAEPEGGLGRCRDCARERGLRVRPEAARLLGKISEQSPAQFASLPVAALDARDLERLTQRLLELHLEKKLRSYAFVKRLEDAR